MRDKTFLAELLQKEAAVRVIGERSGKDVNSTLKEVKRQLDEWFDHTVILQSDDPLVPTFQKMTEDGNCKLYTFPLISSEGLAQYVGEFVDAYLKEKYDSRCWVISSEHHECAKNSAIYEPFKDPDRLRFSDLKELNREILHGDLPNMI